MGPFNIFHVVYCAIVLRNMFIMRLDLNILLLKLIKVPSVSLHCVMFDFISQFFVRFVWLSGDGIHFFESHLQICFSSLVF